MLEVTANNAFIGRQAVLNRNQQLIGYELFFRACSQSRSADQHAQLDADTQVLLNTLNHMGTQWLVGNRLAFMNVGEAMLTSDFLELLPARRVVLDIPSTLVPTGELVSRIRHLRALGFSIALDDFSFDAPSASLLELASYVKLDVQHNDATTLRTINARLRHHPVLRIAERVEEHEHFHRCRELDLDGMQGFYFARPETLSAKVIDPSFSNTLTLLNLLRVDAPIGEVEEVLKHDVALSYQLLHFVNSAAAGLNTSIGSFGHAVTVLGYQKLYRWLILLLISRKPGRDSSSALEKTALTRGRLMELAGREAGLSGESLDNLFIVGLFSLLDAIFDMPMELVLQHLHLPDNITTALIDGTGPCAAFLQLALACETSQLDGIERLCEEVGIGPLALNHTHVDALAWAEQLRV